MVFIYYLLAFIADERKKSVVPKSQGPTKVCIIDFDFVVTNYQWVKHWHAKLVVWFDPVRGRIFFMIKGISLHEFFHYHHSSTEYESG